MAPSLTLNEIRARALAFSKEWKGETSESAEKQTFWNEFFSVFGIHRRRVAAFEVNVDLLKGARGKIDLFWPGVLLVEHKSAGKDLATAFKQATDYFDGLDDKDLPKHVIVSDFARFKVYNLDDKTEVEFPLSKLHTHISAFGFLTGHTFKTYDEAPEVNIKAAQHMADHFHCSIPTPCACAGTGKTSLTPPDRYRRCGDTPMPELITDVPAAEYDTLIAEVGGEATDDQIVLALVRDSEWTEQGAQEVLLLARKYGTSILRNALALASAMQIEDGEAGLGSALIAP